MESYDSFRSLTILFVPNDGHENISSLRVLAEELRERGHKIVFTVNISSKELLTYYGFEEDLNNLSKTGDKQNDKTCEFNLEALKGSPIEVVENFCLKSLVKKFEAMKDREYYYEKLIERVKPDIIIVESMICSPALTNSGIPWVWLNFGPPNFPLNDDRIPPAWSGLPKEGDKKNWDVFREEWNELFENLRTDLNEWCASKGAPELPKNTLHPHSPYLNVCVYPKVLHYRVKKLWPPKWVLFDCLMKETGGKFSIPKELLAKPGKLIYLSMGTYGGADTNLMTRLTAILANSGHKFIVSKGLFDNELPDNMWGTEMLTQTDVLPLVDLVITNGDYKTITNALFYSKPLIVIPLFGEQLDNAQIIKEKEFGLRLDPYTCGLCTTISSINTMLDDLIVKRRLSNISYRMQNSDATKKLAIFIENILNK